MATPIAHAAAGVASLALLRLAMPRAVPTPGPSLVLLAIGCACAPDLDLAVSWLLTGSMLRWHSGPSHSLAFAVLCAGLAALAARGSASRAGLAAIVGLATASHVAVDFVTGPQWGWHQSFGVPALWPWIDERLNSPLTVFRGVRHGGVLTWFSPHNLATAISELVFAVPAVALSLRVLRRRPGRR